MGLFQSGRIGRVETPNRIVMAPLGRARNHPETREPQALSALYYEQRASAALIISEATHVSAGSVSRPGTGANYQADQALAWRRVTDRVHAQGGRIYQQLFHLGRKADPDRLPGGLAPVAPSSIAAAGSLPTASGVKPFPVPRALTIAGIAEIVEEFRRAFEHADAAGFDGVELHAANGFLIEQFLRDDANQRIDSYGDSVENRARFLLELVDAAIDVLGPERVGVRISPHFAVDGPGISDRSALYAHVARALGERAIAYLHLIEPDSVAQADRVGPAIRRLFDGPLILAGGFDRDGAAAAIADGRADYVAFGRLFIANPDLVARFRLPEPPLNAPDEATFYSGGEKGFTDYPRLDSVAPEPARVA